MTRQHDREAERPSLSDQVARILARRGKRTDTTTYQAGGTATRQDVTALAARRDPELTLLALRAGDRSLRRWGRDAGDREEQT